jgi:cation:H+ antiporter
VVGSNVVNLGFVLGGAAIVRTIPTARGLLRRDGAVLVGTTLLAPAFLWDLRVSRREGVVLVALLTGYLAVLVRTGSDRVRAPEEAAPDGGLADVAGLVVGLGGGVVGAHLLVLAASDLARVAGPSEWVIGETVVAAIVRPLPVASAAIGSARWLLATVLLVTVLFWSGSRLSRPEGAVLIELNAVNWAADLLP